MAVSNPKYLPGKDPTLEAGEAITGARFVRLSAAVSESADGHAVAVMSDAGEPAIGVSATDAAMGAKFLAFCGGVVEVLAGEALGHGDLVMAGANGVAMIATEGNVILGTCWADAANAAKALIQLGVLGQHMQAVDAVV